VAKRLDDQDESWHRGRPRHRPHCVRWGPSSVPTERGTAAPLFSPCLCGQTVANLSSCSYFCTMHLTAKFHHPMFNRSEVIMLTSKLTSKQMPLKTSTSFLYATPVSNKLWPLVSVILVTLFFFQETYMNSIYCIFSFGIISV